MLKIVSYVICPFVQRITGLLEAKGVPYEIEYISLKDKPQWFLDIAPNGQVPLLITEDNIALFESDAIAEYLDDEFPLLRPEINKSACRARQRAWVFQGTKLYLKQCSHMQSGNQQIFEERQESMHNQFAKVESFLSGHTGTKYFCADIIGNIDIAWLPLFHRAALVQKHSGTKLFEGFPLLQIWADNVMATGIAAKTVHDSFEDSFVNFYLSDKTYLGGGNKTSNGGCGGSSISCCG
ncbi:Glutathione S-transferase [Shewanella piezotolerans WP3]|uniref:Glutathione S-transferase n=1 Tax=Shewanella piezotolerans (strain WP3 / JCM 13877) TaxID=225849 RepID=B8CVN8_SHEPW|nr:glutathione S-transferase family protein [Shewanella piezotolerans]ACJ31714.1 Glutathione S-transferase [Shewanella piezotolerans WP3]